MVGNNHRLAVEGFCQHYRQPIPACFVQPDGILGRESLAIIQNNGRIRHPLPCCLHGKELACLTEQVEVSPENGDGSVG